MQNNNKKLELRMLAVILLALLSISIAGHVFSEESGDSSAADSAPAEAPAPANEETLAAEETAQSSESIDVSSQITDAGPPAESETGEYSAEAGTQTNVDATVADAENADTSYTANVSEERIVEETPVPKVAETTEEYVAEVDPATNAEEITDEFDINIEEELDISELDNIELPYDIEIDNNATVTLSEKTVEDSIFADAIAMTNKAWLGLEMDNTPEDARDDKVALFKAILDYQQAKNTPAQVLPAVNETPPMEVTEEVTQPNITENITEPIEITEIIENATQETEEIEINETAAEIIIAENITENLTEANVSDITLPNITNATQLYNWTRVIKNKYAGKEEFVFIKLAIPAELKYVAKEIDKKEAIVADQIIQNLATQDRLRLRQLKQTLSETTKDRYTSAEFTPDSSVIKKIRLHDLKLDNDSISIGISDLSIEDSVQSYAIDPTLQNFTSAEITVTAMGSELYKCKEWNFTEQSCYGEWTKVMDLTAGQDYTLTLTPEDPGYKEYNYTFYPATQTNAQKAFKSSNSGAKPPATGPSLLNEIEFNTTDYMRINSSDNNRINTTSILQYRTHRFEFNITEDRQAINYINISWEGYNNGSNVQRRKVELYVFNYTANSWGRVLAWGTVNGDQTLRAYIFDIFNYVNSTGGFTFLVQSNNTGTAGMTLGLFTDFVFLKVNYTYNPNSSLMAPANAAAVNTSTDVNFTCNISADMLSKNITLYWNYSGTFKENQTVLVKGTKNISRFDRTQFFTENILQNKSILWNCYICDNNGLCDWNDINWTAQVMDTTPPKSVTSLNATSYSNDWIYINWTKPSEIDLNYSEVLINGISTANTSLNYYNATGLANDTTYNISIRTVDYAQNINTTLINVSVKTKAFLTNKSITGFNGAAINATVAIASGSEEIYNATAINHSISIDSGLYNLTIIPISSQEIKELRFINYMINSTVDLPYFDYNISLLNYTGTALDSNSIYDSVNVTFNITQANLIKCANYSLATRTCLDEEWQTVATELASGLYIISLNYGDPAFIQLNGTQNTDDAYIRSGTPTTNYGSATIIRVGRAATAGNILRGAIWFNLSNLPSGIRIDKANVSLFFEAIPAGDSAANRTHGIHRMQYNPPRPWAESQATWNNYNTTNAWTSAGGDFNSSSTSNATFNSSQLNSWISFNATRDVQGFVDNRTANFGWIIKDESESSNNFRLDFSSSESANASRRPVIIINYTDIELPNVTLNSPSLNYYNDTNLITNITFNCSSTDNINLKNISLYLTNASNQSFRLNQTATISGLSNLSTWNLSLSRGNYTWNCLAYDAEGNYNWSQNRTIAMNYTFANTPPTQQTPILNSSNGFNASDENLTVYIINPYDLDSDRIYNITDWRINGTSIAVLNLPFDAYNNRTKDFSTYQQSVTEVNSPSYSNTSGIIGGAYTFVANNDGLVISDSNSLDITSAITIETWVKINAFSSGDYIITKSWNQSVEPFSIYSLGLSNNNNFQFTLTSGGVKATCNSTPGSAPTGSWLYVVARWNGSAMEIYVNGTKSGSACLFSGPIDANNKDLRIADSEYSGTTYDFSGTVDDVKVYSRALASEQILANYNSGIPYDRTIYSSMLQPGEIWSAAVTLADGTDLSATLLSNNLSLAPKDIVPPSVFGLRPISNSTFNVSDIIEIAANATDANTSVTSVAANITLPNGTMQQLPLSNVIGNKYNSSFTIPIKGSYTVRFIATDLNGNINSSETTFFKTAGDITPPDVSHLATDNTLYGINDSALVFATITDDVNVSAVIANITNPQNALESLVLSYDPLLLRYEGYYNHTNILGAYTVRIIANDTSGNINNNMTTTFRVVSPNITAVKSDSPDPVEIGYPITYTINATVIEIPGEVPLKFTDLRTINNNTQIKDSPQIIATQLGTLLIAYHSQNATSARDIYVMRSTDKGKNWSSPIRVTDEVENDQFPSLYQDNSGNLMIIYAHDSLNNGIFDIWIVNSSNDGLTWSNPLPVTNTVTISEDEGAIAQDSTGMYYVTYEATDPAFNVNSQIWLHNSTRFTGGWSSKLQLTNSSYMNVDAEFIINNDTFYFAWAPAYTQFQQIWFANLTAPFAANALDNNKFQVTNNSYYNYETSISKDSDDNLYISWVAMLNTSEAALPNVNRTSNEVLIAKSVDNGANWDIRRITNNNISDAYPGIVQTGAEGLYYLTALRTINNNLAITFGERDFSPEDAINVTILDPTPIQTNISNIYQGGTLLNNTAKWNFLVMYAGSTTTVSFDAIVNKSTKNGTVVNNTVNITYYDGKGNFLETTAQTVQTLVVDTLNPIVLNLNPLAGSIIAQSNTVLISANVTDNAIVDTVIANIIYPNSTTQSLVLVYNSTSLKYEYQFNNTSALGDYNMSIFANDTNGNINNSVTTYFTIANNAATTPTNISCNGGSCNNTFNTSINLNCSGSTDPEGDPITYHIEANYKKPRDNTTIINATFESGNESFVYGDDLYGTASAAQEVGRWVTDGNCSSGYCINVQLNVNTPNAASSYSGGWNKTINVSGYPTNVLIKFNYKMRISDSTKGDEYVDLIIRNLSDRTTLNVTKLYGQWGTGQPDETQTGTITYIATLLDGNYSFDAGCNFTLTTPSATKNADCWIDDFNVTEINTSDSVAGWSSLGTHNQTTTYVWNISEEKQQSPVDFRCKAIDTGSGQFSSYFTLGSNTTLKDIAYPQWANNKTSPTSPTTYAKNAQYQFNITWADSSNVDTVLFETNFTGAPQNITYSRRMAYEYFLNRTDIGAGTYYWKSYANDTAGNRNETPAFPYIINPATGTCSLIFNNPTPQTYGFQINASCNCTSTDTAARLYRNGTDVTSTENNILKVLAAGSYYYNCTTPLTQNYTYSQNISVFNITKASSNLSLLLNGSSNNISIRQYGTVNISGYLINGTGNITLYQNGTMINRGLSPLQNITTYPNAGVYNITLDYPATENFSASSVMRFITVNDTTPPSVFDLRPVASTQYNVSQIIEIAANATDNTAVDTVIANITYPNGTILRLTLNNVLGAKYNTTFTIPTLQGRYNITFIANDTFGNINSSTTTFFVGNDTEKPKVFSLVPIAGTNYNTSTIREIAANVTDNGNISAVYANITYPDGTSVRLTLNYVSGAKYNNSFTVPVLVGRYNITFFANDTNNNRNDSETTYFTTNADTLAPNVTSLLPSAGTQYNISSSIQIKANVTDDFGIASVFANISYPNGTLQQIALSNSFGAIYNTSFTVPKLLGRYNITFIATDVNNNVNKSETTYFIANDTINPSVYDIRPISGSIFNLSEIIEIAANVTDNYGISSAYANVTYPNGTVQQISLTNVLGDKYNSSFTVPRLVGAYTIRFVGIDLNGNINSSVTTSFTAVDNIWPYVFALVPAQEYEVDVAAVTEIAANVTDNGNISSVYANITLPNGTVLTLTLNNTFGAKYNNSFAVPNLRGRYNVSFFANDSVNNINASERTYFKTRNALPTITSISLSSTYGMDTTYENLTAYIFNATDLDNESVYNITDWRINGTSIAVLNLPFDAYNNRTKDFSTYNQNVKEVNAIWNSTGGISGSGYYFNGNESGLNITNSPSLNIRSKVTIEAWVKIDGYSNNKVIVAKTAAGGSDPYAIGLGTSNNFYFGLTSGSETKCFSAVNSAQNNVWTQIVGVWDGSSMQMYINGTASGSPCLFSGQLDLSSDNLAIANYPYENTTQDFRGYIDNIRIYNKSLSAEQIIENYNLGMPSYTKISENETSIGDNWTVAVTPADTKDLGDTLISNALLISEFSSNIIITNLSLNLGDSIPDSITDIINSLNIQNIGNAAPGSGINVTFITNRSTDFGLISGTDIINGSNFALNNTYLSSRNISTEIISNNSLMPGLNKNISARLIVPPGQTAGNYYGTVIIRWYS